MACKRCAECRDSNHHWLDNPDFGNGEEPDPEWDDSEAPKNPDYAYICKHCPAVGGECDECQGEAVATRTVGDEDVEVDCPRCEGWGIVEGLAYTAWRDQ